jgi:hypothetical protein
VKQGQSILRDERAQAMTEFVIIIPFIMLVFYIAFEIVAIWHSAMLTRYAAFAAARTAATLDTWVGSTKGQQLAKVSAALALMPVSKPVEGELDFYKARCGASNIKSFLQSCGYTDKFLTQLPSVYNGVVGADQTDNKLEWLFTAWNRLYYDPKAPKEQSYGRNGLFGKHIQYELPLGGTFGTKAAPKLDKIHRAEDKTHGPIMSKMIDKYHEKNDLIEISLELSYNYPLAIPGFQVLWESVAGGTMSTNFGQISSSIMYFFVNEKAKCAVGYEDFYRKFNFDSAQGSKTAFKTKLPDETRIAAMGLELQALVAQLKQLEAAKLQCLTEHPSNAGQALCEAEFDPQIFKIDQQLDGLENQFTNLTRP